MVRRSLLAIASLLVSLPRIASVRAEVQQPSALNVGELTAVDAGEAVRSDTFYVVNIFEQLEAFGNLSLVLDNAAKRQDLDKNVASEGVYSCALDVASRVLPMLQDVHAWDDPVVRQIREVVGYSSRYFDYRNNPLQQWTLRELQVSSEKWMCAFVSAAFSTTVMDRNGDSWLFSDAFDNDLAALDRAIAREFDAAYHGTHFHYFLYYETLLPLFDRVYDRCVGDKLTMLHRLQVN